MKPVFLALVAVAFVIAFAAYWSDVASAPVNASPTPAFTYGQIGSYAYVAALAPNSLYNQTTLTQGNGTLFSAITSWVNLTFGYRVVVNRSAALASTVSMSVVLGTNAWSKTLGTVSGRTVAAAADTATVAVQYDLNVTNVSLIAQAVASETHYAPGYFTVLLSPTVATSVVAGSAGTGLVFSAPLTLNFTNEQILPSALLRSTSGSYVPADGPTAGTAGNTDFPYALLVAALGAEAFLGVLAYDAFRQGPPAPKLDDLTRPYEEAIAATTTPPPAAGQVSVPTWGDLVKVADTLGRPILRLRPAGPSAPGAPSTFYVLADERAYVLELPRPASPTEATPGPQAPATAGRAPGGRAGPDQSTNSSLRP